MRHDATETEDLAPDVSKSCYMCQYETSCIQLSTRLVIAMTDRRLCNSMHFAGRMVGCMSAR